MYFVYINEKRAAFLPPFNVISSYKVNYGTKVGSKTYAGSVS